MEALFFLSTIELDTLPIQVMTMLYQLGSAYKLFMNTHIIVVVVATNVHNVGIHLHEYNNKEHFV